MSWGILDNLIKRLFQEKAEKNASNVSDNAAAWRTALEVPTSTALTTGLAGKVNLNGDNAVAVDFVKNLGLNSRFNATAGRQGLEFNGVSGFVAIPLDAAKRPAYGLGDFSVGGWVNVRLRTGFTQHLFSTGTTSAGGGLEIFLNPTNILLWRKSGGDDPKNVYNSSTQAKDGWQHILFIRKDGVTKLYYNGVEAYSVDDVNSYERPFTSLGARQNVANFFQGAYSDVIDLNYAIPATTTDGIPGVAERYRDGRFLTSGDLLGAGTPVANSFDFSSSTDGGTTSNERVDMIAATDGGRVAHYFNFPVTAGQIVRVTVSGFSINTGSASLTLRDHDSLGTIISQAAVVVNTDGVYQIVVSSSRTKFALRVNCAGGANYEVEYNFSVKIFGATLALESEGIQAERGQWLDSSNPPKHALQAATGTKPLLRLSTSITVVAGVNATSAVFLLGARNILTDDWTVESVEVFNDGAGSAEINLEFSNGSAHVNLTGATTTIAAGTSKRLQVVNGKPTAYNRIRATGNAGADDMRFILALKPRR